ncbi:hypothetical protein M9458_031132, partial [Cirrhinus mrigala]
RVVYKKHGSRIYSFPLGHISPQHESECHGSAFQPGSTCRQHRDSQQLCCHQCL